MNRLKKAKLFQSAGCQAVRLPKELQFEGGYVYIKQMGNAVILIPQEVFWALLVDNLDKFTDDFMENRNQPKQGFT